MTAAELREALMRGIKLVFAKRLNAQHQVRAVMAVTFDRRKGFHVVEKSLKQLRSAVEREGGVYFLALADDKFLPVTEFREALASEIPQEREQEICGALPRFDFTVQVQSQRLLKKIGFFR